VEYKADMCKKNRINFPTHFRVGDHGYFSRFGYAALYAARMAARTHLDTEQEWTSEWTQLLRIRVGSILVNSLMDVATVTRTGVDKRTNEPM
jgi:DNA-directed RNA polymerase